MPKRAAELCRKCRIIVMMREDEKQLIAKCAEESSETQSRFMLKASIEKCKAKETA